MTFFRSSQKRYVLPRDPSNSLRRSVSRTLRNAFLATDVKVSADGKWIPAPSAAGVLGSPLQVITAWNPFGLEQTVETNRMANSQLKSELQARGWTVHPALGESRITDWSEESWAVIAQSRRQLRKLARDYGQLAIFSITRNRVTVIGASASYWSDNRPPDLDEWAPPRESGCDLAEAIAQVGLPPATNGPARAMEHGWVHEDGCGIACPRCGAPAELFGCEPRWPPARGAGRRTALVCTAEHRVLKGSEVPAPAAEVVAARREYLIARADADLRSRLQPRYAVYCIELEPKASESQAGRPPIYVGQTSRTPEERFAQHKDGYRASTHVKNRGLRLRPDLTAGLPMPRTEAEALGLERWLAASMRAAGWDVEGGT